MGKDGEAEARSGHVRALRRTLSRCSSGATARGDGRLLGARATEDTQAMGNARFLPAPFLKLAWICGKTVRSGNIVRTLFASCVSEALLQIEMPMETPDADFVKEGAVVMSSGTRR
ncbi:hypothetical protein AAFF_G00019650 [Aldrovandia affinis]|uniref:Uncharacterized protein n=1 Tax=Aldrovandia affinis TaxID=143900 RepID=A0AAD7WGX7_9TELE|nr:hypothetical protein AAFF_G00019650 [Aldrovandia affinis]